ncbi:MAG TPA: hypothetical protein VGC54_13820 [Planctomycetota bacterium]
METRIPRLLFVAGLAGVLAGSRLAAQDVVEAAPELLTAESRYYRIVDVPTPKAVALEVGGLLALGDGSVLASTRRGEVWRIRDAYGPAPQFDLWARGLHEPLGLLAHGGWIYVAQRGELTRMKDADGDGRADLFETVCDFWKISGNYHEYNFGPRLDAEGNLWITTNKPFGDEPFGRVDWRGWALRIAPGGSIEGVCAGLRSPAGIEASPAGEMFYTDNQGEWCGASKLSHLEVGDFHGHPWGIAAAKLPQSRVAPVEQPPSGMLMPDYATRNPAFKLPAVWFPYDKMGKSPSGFVWDTSAGAFGPFAGQVFVGDQHHAMVIRVSLEQVGGRWQGACYPFKYGFASGIVRVAWGEDGSLLAGMTNRGWGSRGGSEQGLQRLEWTGAVPFEIQAMTALPDGFRLRFTQPADPATAADPSAYALQSYTYKLHSDYGSPESDVQPLAVAAAALAADGLSVDLHVEGLREGYVHELIAAGVRAPDGRALLHAQAYYTLVRIPPATPAGR